MVRPASPNGQSTANMYNSVAIAPALSPVASPSIWLWLPISMLTAHQRPVLVDRRAHDLQLRFPGIGTAVSNPWYTNNTLKC